MSTKGVMGQACAACKYQRRKCSPDCPLALYFPPDRPKQFLNTHKLFGVSNILKLLKTLDKSQRGDAMKSVIYEANAREADPVYGCFGVVLNLQAKIQLVKQELEATRSQIAFYEKQHFQNRPEFCNDSNEVQQEEEEKHMVKSPDNGLDDSWIPPLPSSGCYDSAVAFDAQNLYPIQCVDFRDKVQLKFQQGRHFGDSRDSYESSDHRGNSWQESPHNSLHTCNDISPPYRMSRNTELVKGVMRVSNKALDLATASQQNAASKMNAADSSLQPPIRGEAQSTDVLRLEAQSSHFVQCKKRALWDLLYSLNS